MQSSQPSLARSILSCLMTEGTMLDFPVGIIVVNVVSCLSIQGSFLYLASCSLQQAACRHQEMPWRHLEEGLETHNGRLTSPV